ncbi:PREDICTED: protein NRT1/ PTR FAMILY 2.6-like [Ipomoea nil]|uniref:protein NRT1/ PTR FAMILY 2.6-like n=1 Tax=Ipomoea nil TaxID=35883 RepID=UPI0009011CA4|nr:PREDICTED: protein NRT1/ PTR FAMILY 2.6-like [Ipomoea nil]
MSDKVEELCDDREVALSPTAENHKGGWITFPFILVSTGGLMLGGAGWMTNLMVFLINTYHVQKIDAVQISTLIHAFFNLFPVFAAIIADSFLSSFTVIWIFGFTSLLGTIVLTLSTIISALKPPECPEDSSSCTPNKLQFAVLYAALSLGTVGLGGLRSSISTMGANQFRKKKHQGIFFNWYFITSYMSFVIAQTVFVYIEDNVSFKCGFIICVVANSIGLIAFLSGTRFYSCGNPKGSPFTGLARVLVASVHKRNLKISDHETDGGRYFVGDNEEEHRGPPSSAFKFLNRAAVKMDGDVDADGLIEKPWRICTVQQVEDLKSLIKMIPVWTTGIILLVPIGALLNLTVVQALTMDRHLGKKFQIPPGSMTVVVLFSCTVFIAVIDRLVYPAWKKLAGKRPTALQKIGVGHVITLVGMAVSAVVEYKRRIAAANSEPISVLWLIPPLLFIGVGEAFHYPVTAQFYYQEFPANLKNMATALSAVLIAIALYVASLIIELIRNVTSWLPNNDIDKGRLDYVYWVLFALGLLNYGYFLACANYYKYQNCEKPKNDDDKLH